LAFEIMNLTASPLLQKLAVAEVEACNDYTADYGLTLSHKDAVELVETRTIALKSTGRIEFGGGVIDQIIRAFCDSPFIAMHNYVETIHELTEIFYYYKNETLDLMNDEDLIKFMKTSFNGVCQGSLELLSGRELASMARNLRFGQAMDYSEESNGQS